ncbi:MAG: DpnII family type II restriction endonuclease, partial [Rickettsiales bacterium]
MDLYKQHIDCSDDNAVFAYLLSTLKQTIKGWDYFVNWEKVLHNYSKFEHELNLLNSLIGKENIEQEAEILFQQFHQMVTQDNFCEPEKLGKLCILAGVKEFPMRVKCATLA